MTTVLIIDDHAGFLCAAVAVCDATPGFDVVGTATNANDAVTLASRERPDLVLVDVRLASDDGIGLAERLRELLPAAEVVVCSTLAREDLPHRAFAGRHLQKDELSVRSLTALASPRVA